MPAPMELRYSIRTPGIAFEAKGCNGIAFSAFVGTSRSSAFWKAASRACPRPSCTRARRTTARLLNKRVTALACRPAAHGASTSGRLRPSAPPARNADRRWCISTRSVQPSPTRHPPRFQGIARCSLACGDQAGVARPAGSSYAGRSVSPWFCEPDAALRTHMKCPGSTASPVRSHSHNVASNPNCCSCVPTERRPKPLPRKTFADLVLYPSTSVTTHSQPRAWRS